MEWKKAARRFREPCARCPYRRKLVHTLVNPCPRCKANGYQMFERFQREHENHLRKDE